MLVCIVDDDPVVTDILTDFTRDLGHETVTAETAADIRRKLEGHPNEVALFIIELFVRDGHAGNVVPTLERDHPSAKFVVISSYEPPERLVEQLGSSVIAWLRKPFELVTLEKAIQEAMDTSGK